MTNLQRHITQSETPSTSHNNKIERRSKVSRTKDTELIAFSHTITTKDFVTTHPTEKVTKVEGLVEKKNSECVVKIYKDLANDNDDQSNEEIDPEWLS